MSVGSRRWIPTLLSRVAAYDAARGIAFLLFPAALFDTFDVPPPNHMGYVQFPACLLIVFGIMFAAIARAPERNRNLIPYGILLKISYCGVVFFYWFSQDIPVMWKPFAVVDGICLVLFCVAYARLSERG